MSISLRICMTRKMRSFWWKRRKRCKKYAVWIVLLFLFFVMLYYQQSSLNEQIPHACDLIDVVYTWVNGSDVAFMDSLRKYSQEHDAARFDDKNELRYSLRSLEKYAPWIKHVYIVTNGQVPYWLDLSYDKVTVVPHEILVPTNMLNTLPTFSSSAIETFLHRIPNLSKRFLYMNDDIFLGAPLYPEDLYTDAEGVRIYQAWLVPECADDCPWTYIGDGACDRHCNIEQCQFDGGDCSENKKVDDAGLSQNSEEQSADNEPINSKFQSKNITLPIIRKFPLRKKFRNLKQTILNSRNKSSLYSSKSSFKEHLKYLRIPQNNSGSNDLRNIVDSYNSVLKTSSVKKLKTTTTTAAPSLVHHSTTYYSTKDIYSQSLINTNMLLNRHYGFRARNVLAHVGFLLDSEIIKAMHLRFPVEVKKTASQRLRSAEDLQFAFAYYSFLMAETKMLTVGEIFDEFDTDNSMTWSDREVRTFLARMYPLPLDWSAVRFFEEVIENCSRNFKKDFTHESSIYSTLVYERYEDSTLPTITRRLVENCPLLAEALLENFSSRPKYKYNINPKRAVHSNFMMLTSNITEVVDSLDKLRRNPRKFNCINDNLEPNYPNENELIRHLLEDFYLSFFPHPSKFELNSEYRNRFTNWTDYQKWRRRKRTAIVVGYAASLVLMIFLMRFLCLHKAKLVRRCVQKL